MKNAKTLMPVLAILLCVSLSCTFLKDKFVKDPNAVVGKAEDIKIQKFDRNAPLVSPGSEVVKRLAELDPSLSRFGPKIEAVERTVMQMSIDSVPKEPDTKINTPKAAFESNKPDKNFPSGIPSVSMPATMMMLQANSSDTSSGRSSSAALVGAMIAGLKQIFTEGHTKAVAGGVKDTKTTTKDGVKTTMGVELKYREDGSSVFGMQFETEATDKDGTKLTTQLSGRVDGNDCPNALGQVPLTVNMRIGGESGGTGYTQDVEAFIRTTVDDDANVATTTIDITQGVREVLKGDDIYVETGYTVSSTGPNLADYKESNWRLIRHSQSAASDIPKSMSIAAGGQEAATSVAMTILLIAAQKWQNGGCVKIDAPAPGKVEPSSVTEIPVNVTHKFDGSSVPSKVKVDLAGETSVTPKQIDQTPGKLSYTAPPEKNKSATIKLEARSKRGRSTLDLNATTGGNAYRISGNIDEAKMSGTTCDSSQPFTIGGTLSFNFTPTSATTGNYTYRGPYAATGSGPYVINGDGSMKLDGTGCIMGGSCKTYSHSWTAEQIDPASCNP